MSAAYPPQMGRTLPEPPPTFNGLTPASTAAETKSILASSATLRDELVRTLSPVTATFANLVRPLADDANRIARRLSILGSLLSSVSPDPALRDASREAAKQIAAAEVANHMRRDFAELVAAVFMRSQADDGDDGKLDEQDRYLLARIHGEYVRSGAGIQDDAQRARFQAALLELNELRVAAQKTFTEADDGVWFSRAELAGVPDDALATMKVANGEGGSHTGDKLWVTFRNDHLRDVMRYASSGETRQRLYVAQQHRFPENVTRLAKIVVLRDEIARLVGFENRCALKIEEKMAQSVGEVESCLHELRQRLEPLAKAETERLLLFKKRDIVDLRDAVTTTGSDEISELFAWDSAYYSHKQRKETYSVNSGKLAEYFEVKHTIKGMLRVFENLFDMKFEG